MSEERTGVATIQGNPLTLIGPELKVGDKAPDFTINKDLIEEASLSDYEGKIKLISVVPSLDTSVCEAQTRRFNEEASKLGDKVKVITISVDLPFAQGRFCSVAGIENLDTLSDYKFRSFGKSYGVLIKELQLDMRSIFILDESNTIRYVEYLEEMTNHPDYDAALSAVKALL
ncbi:thiol peroxidase [Sporolactobacillus laevolacticus]|uniref:Thiol peroxidase n=1 Tax=Sporolactobacillus laevolacticus DSM 442 TaxID=1395513 RepID=V6J0F1_9BACL|nr:thiol peroxidase [Sporolactobacillus laevolacticus]EST13285.1 lipid hydroperoxide peroxidase [Sporolactobacillus laevolacticus DSM 442]